eukprot:TRINITY_DN18567_c0_g1_i3.p1 TRINITY_DN18567_c0_g1~~TRINITY_DN18567_c0_g1_i3.p1  ORF type:complete len:753 (-),score=76.50 TRINITY_DN18567_c0_g1_i3:105-2363(-)
MSLDMGAIEFLLSSDYFRYTQESKKEASIEMEHNRTEKLRDDVQKQRQVMNVALLQARASVQDLDDVVGGNAGPNTPHGCNEFLSETKRVMHQFTPDDFMDPLACDVDFDELRVFCHEISEQFSETFLTTEHGMAETLEDSLSELNAAKTSFRQANELLNAHLLPSDENVLPLGEAWPVRNSRAQQLVIDRVFATHESWTLQTVCDSLLPLWAYRPLLTSLCEKLVQKYAIMLRQRPEQADIDQCSLLMIALKKHTQLKLLHSKILKNAKIGQFLDHDFSQPEWKVKASKNAFVLLSHHRYHLAAAFFLLANDVHEAIAIFVTRWKSPMLAVLLGRLFCGDDHEVVREVYRSILDTELKSENPSTKAIDVCHACLGTKPSSSMPNNVCSTFCDFTEPGSNSKRMYGYMHRGFCFLALQACVNNSSSDYDAKQALRRTHLISGLLLHHFIQQHDESSGIACSNYLIDEGAQVGVEDGELVSAMAGIEVESVWRSVREHCRRRDLLEAECVVWLYTDHKDGIEEAMRLIEGGGESLMFMLGSEVLDDDEDRRAHPHDWCQKARAIISCLQLVNSFSKEACQKFSHVYKIAVGQVILAITVLCMLRQDYADLLKLTVAINDENFNFGWKNDVNVWGEGFVTEEQLANLSSLLRKGSLGLKKDAAIVPHCSVALWYIEVFVLTIVSDGLFELMHEDVLLSPRGRNGHALASPRSSRVDPQNLNRPLTVSQPEVQISHILHGPVSYTHLTLPTKRIV